MAKSVIPTGSLDGMQGSPIGFPGKGSPASPNEPPEKGEKQSSPELRASRFVLASILGDSSLRSCVDALAPRLEKAMSSLFSPLSEGSDLSGSILNLAQSLTLSTELSTIEAENTEPAQVEESPYPWPETLADDLEELIKELGNSGGAREAADTFREIAGLIFDLQAAAVVTPGSGGQIPDQRQIQEVVKRLDKLKRLIQRLRTQMPDGIMPRFQQALDSLWEEVTGSAVKKALISLPFSGAGYVADMLTKGGVPLDSPSTISLGREIHARFQKAYRSNWLSRYTRGLIPHRYGDQFIIQEGIVYRNPLQGKRLYDEVKNTTDGSLYALFIARLNDFLLTKFLAGSRLDEWMDSFWAQYKDDTLDTRMGQIWEIKPIRSTSIGVYQELQYRHGFNLVNAFLQDAMDLASNKSKSSVKKIKILRGFVPRYFSCPEPLKCGSGMPWEGLKKPFVIYPNQKNKLSAPRAVLPITIPQLDGLLLYVTWELPKELVAALAAKVLSAIQQAIEKGAREFARNMEQMLDALVQVIIVFAMFAAMALLVALFFIATAGAAAAAAAAARQALVMLLRMIPAAFMPAFTAMGASGNDPDSILASLVKRVQEAGVELETSPSITGEEVVIKFKAGKEGIKENDPVIDMIAGPFRFYGLPVSLLPVVAGLQALAAPLALVVLSEGFGVEKRGVTSVS